MGPFLFKQSLSEESIVSQIALANKYFCAIIPGNNPEYVMAKGSNPLKTEEVSLSLNPQSVWYLDRLIETGLYGNTRPQAAAIALFDHCKMLIAQGTLSMAPPLPGSGAVQVTRP
ncbi:hypothetical protein XH93_00860 [Bradyrhizobium sp. CCBAU 51753]|nr:hypothetical protein XH93_00860 [Bradyrhizobium sp. CCBAU 51753]